MNRRKKHFAKLRGEEIRRKLPTKAQKRIQMSTYLKNMAGFKHSQLKSKGYDEIQKLFDKEMKRVNTFLDMNSEVVKGSETRTEESYKRAGDELESDMSKMQKIDKHVEAEKDDDLTGSLYPKTYWELLPKEILGATTQRDTGSYYPKRYWELLPKERL
ncbi:hypothetical protein Tco_1173801 [Tanacetum coccineum]